MFQPCAPRPALMEVPVCGGTSVCVLVAGQEQAATQVHCLWGSLNTPTWLRHDCEKRGTGVTSNKKSGQCLEKHCLHQCVAQKMLLTQRLTYIHACINACAQVTCVPQCRFLLDLIVSFDFSSCLFPFLSCV